MLLKLGWIIAISFRKKLTFCSAEIIQSMHILFYLHHSSRTLLFLKKYCNLEA